MAARARAVVAGMQRQVGATYTLSQFATDAVNAHAQGLERRFNDGQPWPHPHALLVGTRIGGAAQPPPSPR